MSKFFRKLIYRIVLKSWPKNETLYFLDMVIARLANAPRSRASTTSGRRSRGSGSLGVQAQHSQAPAGLPERRCCAELKGSVGEGPNHSNHSNHSNSFKIGIFPRKFKNFRNFNFQHFLNYRRNSDRISSKSEQKSVKRIQK